MVLGFYQLSTGLKFQTLNHKRFKRVKIVIIGAGNVATVFGRRVKAAGHTLLQVFSRQVVHAKALADELVCGFTTSFYGINQSADIYIIALPDEALANIADGLQLGNKLVVHTAGSVSINVLKRVSENYGVVYPLQSLRKENADMEIEMPLLVDGNNENTLKVIESFAKTISNMVGRTNDEQRLKMHIAAVVVNNFTNHLYSLAEDYCKEEKVDFKMLQPLIEETAIRLRNYSPKDMQTGPAARKDISTTEKHLKLLSSYPKLYELYSHFTKSIIQAE